MPAILKIGTVLIKEGTRLPQGLSFGSKSYAPGWRLVKNLDGRALARKIDEAGGTFSRMDDEINVTVFGFDERKTARKAVEQILTNLRSGKFNSLEITRVGSVASERFLGVTYLTVCAHPTEIKESPIRVPIMET